MMTPIKWIKQILNSGDEVFFQPMHKDYGKAEFIVCPIWKYGKLKRVFIYPRQQESKVYYDIECGYSDSIHIDSWTHKGINEPKIWFHTWCKEHKTQAIHLYVPTNSNMFIINVLSSFNINFDYKNKGI